ncbi:hypothetical protein GCM10027341_19670 [Spirosoma knui]
MIRQLHRSHIWASLFFLILWPVSGRSSADRTGDQILGRWLFPSKGSSVDVYRLGSRYFARVAEVDQAGQKNYGLAKDKVLISNLAFNGRVWTDGELIHPKTGTALDVELRMSDQQTMTVTLYKGIKLLHKKFDMTRKSTL